ncbi:unnamed protein product [Euphydryas editha]|uniref:Peptidase S1 domain-containing protein n=1 Tax=Euphydryas editha TaxID=104508 RepID=A0AAU9U6D3_EUPED|nr:unnamed protein product [Euphydryas editha]
MILRNLLLFCILVLYGCENTYARECNSCMNFRECPELLEMIQRMNIIELSPMIQRAKCEIGYKNGQRIPKICCEDFIQIGSRNGINETKVEETVNIETHKNIALLPEICGRIDGDRIIGGEIPGLYELPWMALILVRDNGIFKTQCGGTIINNKYILTAAHCVRRRRTAVVVRVGEYDINSKVDCQGEHPFRMCETHIQDIRVDKYIIHENFTSSPTANDIALIRLKKPIDFSFKNVEPICLPIYDKLRNMDISTKNAVVSGWGITEFKSMSNFLRKVEIPIKTDFECKQHYSSEISDSDTDMKFICAGDESKDSCNGDSGGPLTMEEEYKDNYRIIQFGIVSKGSKQCGLNVPGLYTDVRKYIKWILDKIEE